MEGYRHLNILISGKTYNVLKETSYRLGKPVSEIVRNGIALVLKDNNYKRSEGVKNADN